MDDNPKPSSPNNSSQSNSGDSSDDGIPNIITSLDSVVDSYNTDEQGGANSNDSITSIISDTTEMKNNESLGTVHGVIKSPSSEQQLQPQVIPSLTLNTNMNSHHITTTSARISNSYDLFNSSSLAANASSSSANTNSDLAISFFIPSSPSQQIQQDRESYSFSPQLITNNRRVKPQQANTQHQCDDNCNHQTNDFKKVKGLGNNIWRRLQRGVRSFNRIFCSSQETEESGDMPVFVIAQDMSVRIHLFSAMFLHWLKALIVLIISFVMNMKTLIATGGYKQLFTRKNVSDSLNNVSSWIQSLQNTNPEAYWLIGHVQHFVSFFISPLSLSSSRNYSLTFQQHQQLKTHFLFCFIILTFSFLEISIGFLQYGSTHNHESSTSTHSAEHETLLLSFRNHGFMVSLLILFSGFYLLHRGFMFLIDLVVIYIKTTQEENTLQGSSGSVISKSSITQFKSTNNTNDSSPLDTNSNNTNADSSILEEEGAVKRLLFQPYTYTLWKRLRVLLRFANAVFSSFLSLSIFSEMIQYVLTTKFSKETIEPVIENTSSDKPLELLILDSINEHRVGIFTYLLVLFGMLINVLSIYLFGNYSGSNSYQTKKNEEDFLFSSSDKRKTSTSTGRANVSLNRMNSSPMWFQQFSSFTSVVNTSQTSTIGRLYNNIHTTLREKIPSAKFWIYIVMREAHIHIALLIYLKTVYYTAAPISFDFILCCMSTMTCLYFSLPVLKANGKILLQTTPESLSNHLNSCVKEVSSMVEGVLECHSEHFWALNCSSLDEADDEEIEIDADKRKQELIATIKVRVANNVQVDHQRVLQSVRKIFCSNGLLKEHNLTVQVEKNTILGLEKIYQDE